MTSPSVLVLDEPKTFLDLESARQIFGMLEKLKGHGKAVILAEHRLEWVAEYAAGLSPWLLVNSC